jgi:hypothetical protein
MTERDLEYERRFAYDDDKIMCKNYEICRNVLSEECHFSYLCPDCAIELEFVNNLSCDICHKQKRCVRNDQILCIHCAMKMRYDNKYVHPRFPYSEEVYIKYVEDPNDSCPHVDYPLIRTYNELCDIVKENFKERKKGK